MDASKKRSTNKRDDCEHPMSALPKYVPSNVAHLFDTKQTDELPSPFNQAQVVGLSHDLETIERTMEAASAADRDAATLHVIATWTARAARHYAWSRICEL